MKECIVNGEKEYSARKSKRYAVGQLVLVSTLLIIMIGVISFYISTFILDREVFSNLFLNNLIYTLIMLIGFVVGSYLLIEGVISVINVRSICIISKRGVEIRRFSKIVNHLNWDEIAVIKSGTDYFLSTITFATESKPKYKFSQIFRKDNTYISIEKYDNIEEVVKEFTDMWIM